MDAKAFWGNVNPLIKSRKTTQRVLAQEIGVSFGTFQGWIARNTLPDAIETYRIAQALNTTVEYLVSGKSPSKPDIDPIIQDLESALGKLKKLS